MHVTQAGDDRLLRIAVAAPQGRLVTQEARRQLFMLGWNRIAPAAKEPVVARPAGAIELNLVLARAATAENANVPLLVPASFAEQGIWSPHQRRALCTQEKLDTASLFGAMDTDGRVAILFAVMTALFLFILLVLKTFAAETRSAFFFGGVARAPHRQLSLRCGSRLLLALQASWRIRGNVDLLAIADVTLTRSPT